MKHGIWYIYIESRGYSCEFPIMSKLFLIKLALSDSRNRLRTAVVTAVVGGWTS